MFSDDIKLMSMTPEEQKLTAIDNPYQGSEEGACSPLHLYLPLVTRHETDDS